MSNNTPIATFDMYRTLIDFDLNRAALPIVKDRLDEVGIDYAEFQDNLRVMRFYAVQEGPYTRYQDLVRKTLKSAMALHGARYEDEFGDQLIEEAKKFPAFPEVPQALRELKEKGVELAIITNSDREFAPYGVENIGVEFDYVITAEDAGWYKPNDGAFEYLFKTIDRDPSLITHVAQGWDYDMIPAKKYGVRRIWVNRYNLKGSDFYQPYFEIPDLSSLPSFWDAKA